MDAFDNVIEETWKLDSMVEQSHALEGERSMSAEKLKLGESSMEASSCRMATQLIYHERDIVAAHTLVQMCTEDSDWLPHGLNSHGVKNSMKGMRRMRSDDVGGQMDNGDRVVLASSAVPCPRRSKPRKMDNRVKLWSRAPKYVNINVCEEEDNNLYDTWRGNNDQKAIEAGIEDRNDRLGKLKVKKRKRVASYCRKETEDVAVSVRPSKWPVPTVQTNVPFSIIHLLTAIRRAMVSGHAEGSALVYGIDQEKNNEKMNGGIRDSMLENPIYLPYQTLNQIVKRVRSNPIDPRILHTREPLQELVRGVLKIFSSKKAHLRSQGWKPLTLYDKSSERWLWIGPLKVWYASQSLSITTPVNDADIASEEWGLPHQMLVDLVDSFAIWFNSFQELYRVGSPCAPPLVLTRPTSNESKRFRGLKRKMNIATIGPSADEVRAHFRKEEALRHLLPDRGFRYTALDGIKSAVAPIKKLNKVGGCHVILKAKRPPHYSTLCLLREAAARLPGGIGTRADICTLMRDSQYLLEDVSDEQLHTFASKGLDRLHYEADPCVKYNGKVWVYLHRYRGEDDFEDDATTCLYVKKKYGEA